MPITSKKNFRKRNLRKGNRRSRIGKRRNVRSKQSGGAETVLANGTIMYEKNSPLLATLLKYL